MIQSRGRLYQPCRIFGSYDSVLTFFPKFRSLICRRNHSAVGLSQRVLQVAVRGEVPLASVHVARHAVETREPTGSSDE